MASYNTSGITSYTDTSSIAGISAASGQDYSSSSSGLMSASPSRGRNRDADMYAGSKYAPTKNAGTAKAKQSFAATATSSDDDDNGYTPTAIAAKFEAAGATLPPARNPMDRFRDTMASSLYDSDVFKPYVPDPTEEIETYLGNTAVEDALKDALGIDDTQRQTYQGIPTAEEPEPNIDMSVLQAALMPEPITVEEIEVKAGDTLSAIAAENNLPVQDVIDANPQIKNPNLIRPGEVVSLPAAQAEVGAARASIMPAQQEIGEARAAIIMKGIDKLFGMFPPKTKEEKAAKSELEYFLDAQPDSVLPDFFKYVPDTVQVQEYLKGRADRKMEGLARESAELAASERDAAGITRSLTPEEVAARNNVAGTDPRELGGAEGYGSVGTPADAETGEGLMSPRFDTKGDTGLTTFYEDIGKKAESDHGSTPVATKDARETKEYIDGKLNPNYIANEADRSKDVGYGHKVTAAEEASGKIRGVSFKNDDGTYKELTEEDKITILNADMQAHKEAALDAGWETKLANIGTSWNELDPSYQRALTSLAYNVGGKKAGEDWTAVLKAAKDKDVVDFARQLRRKDAGRYTAGMDNRVIKELKFAGLIDKRSDVSTVLPLANASSGVAN